MATRFLHRSFPHRSPILLLRRTNQTAASSPPPANRRYPPPAPHEFSKPCGYLGSWTPTKEPREAEARLERLRRDYARQVKQLRKEYAYEMEMQRMEKQRKDDARREAARLANEERKASKAAAAKTRAAERMVVEEEFRQALLKERAEKLENWKAKEKMKEEKKNGKKELLRQQSSMWISVENLEKRVLEAIVDTTPL
ncbi:uncharacterized protein [Typha latifolia]|uniref:uncharacterized protein n=1 Tax=Typha latifolia TaxID=4733 RepID=UPI003C2BC4A6